MEEEGVSFEFNALNNRLVAIVLVVIRQWWAQWNCFKWYLKKECILMSNLQNYHFYIKYTCAGQWRVLPVCLTILHFCQKWLWSCWVIFKYMYQHVPIFTSFWLKFRVITPSQGFYSKCHLSCNVFNFRNDICIQRKRQLASIPRKTT